MTQKSQTEDALGNRMKALEGHETQRRFLPGLPVYARIDGRGFSKFTKGMRRPYDPRMTAAMIATTKFLVSHTNARIGYVQSDEISLAFQANDYNSAIFFDGKITKMTSVLASLATAGFTKAIMSSEDEEFRAYAEKAPHFDARVIQMPSRDEVANMFLWRNIDAAKNAVSMAAHHYFPHKSLQGVGGAAMQERLFKKAGVNFNDFPACFKRGTFVRRITFERHLTEAELSRIPEGRRPETGSVVTRSEVREIEVPIFNKVTNRVGVIFHAEEPRLADEIAVAA